MNQSIDSRLSHGFAGTTGLRPVIASLLSGARKMLALWYERSRQRRDLARLDDRLLRDIGLDRATVELEIAKPFWRP
ncbi:MAG: DUF1127 domain-containing protein [Rhodospirillales bacterium]|nr:MAG: DUF1127 domain-containing protein [Rhodospirillales bacterium]